MQGATDLVSRPENVVVLNVSYQPNLMHPNLTGGHYNFVALLKQVITRHQPTEVLLSGGSAGGMAVHPDWAAQILKMQGIPLRCMPDAGMFPGSNRREPFSYGHTRTSLTSLATSILTRKLLSARVF